MQAVPIDDNSGRLLYWGHGSSNYSHVATIEGNIVNNYNDASLHRITMSTDVIEDITVKFVGVEAKEPTGTGAKINIITKSGGNDFSGSVGFTYQPNAFYGNNIPEGDPALPKRTRVYQADASIGGPIKTDKVWFFGAYRRADLDGEIGFNDVQATNFRALIPGWETYTNGTKQHQPYVKVTASLNPNHQLNGYWQHDRINVDNNRAEFYEKILLAGAGGSVFGGKLTSLWGTNTTTQLTATYNNKSGNNQATRDLLPGSGPWLDFTADTFISGGIIRGTGDVGIGGNVQSIDFQPASMLIFRGDLTRFVEDWGGSHEFGIGTFLAPSLKHDRLTNYSNDGLIFEERVITTPGFPETQLQDRFAESVPFHQRFVDTVEIPTLAGRDHDYGFYVQDNWKPNERLTLNLGIRADFVRRYDSLFDVERMNSVGVGPRLGVSYLVTEDARNVLRASWGRVHDAVNGRDHATSSRPARSRPSQRDIYDNDLDGVFETVRLSPVVDAAQGGWEFEEGLHQPFTDEYLVGFRKQFPGQIAIDIAGVRRVIKDRYAFEDVNGIYPDGPGQPFIGFGRVDPSGSAMTRTARGIPPIRQGLSSRRSSGGTARASSFRRAGATTTTAIRGLPPATAPRGGDTPSDSPDCGLLPVGSGCLATCAGSRAPFWGTK